MCPATTHRPNRNRASVRRGAMRRNSSGNPVVLIDRSSASARLLRGLRSPIAPHQFELKQLPHGVRLAPVRCQIEGFGHQRIVVIGPRHADLRFDGGPDRTPCVIRDISRAHLLLHPFPIDLDIVGRHLLDGEVEKLVGVQGRRAEIHRHGESRMRAAAYRSRPQARGLATRRDRSCTPLGAISAATHRFLRSRRARAQACPRRRRSRTLHGPSSSSTGGHARVQTTRKKSWAVPPVTTSNASSRVSSRVSGLVTRTSQNPGDALLR